MKMNPQIQNRLNVLEQRQRASAQKLLRAVQSDPVVYDKIRRILQPTGLSNFDWGNLANKLTEAAINIKTSDRIADQQKSVAEAELKKMQEQTSQMQKQIEAQREMNKLALIQSQIPTKTQLAKETAVNAVMDNKMMLAIAGGLAAVLVFMRMKKA